VQLHGIHGRYATALYTAAVKTKKVDEIASDLARIKQFISADAKINAFLETPILSKLDKIAGVEQLLAKGKYSAETLNFFVILAENGRLDMTHKILLSFEQLISAHHGHVAVVVTSAKVCSNLIK
jgi:F-type H+-transporting ATPase subunit O